MLHHVVEQSPLCWVRVAGRDIQGPVHDLEGGPLTGLWDQLLSRPMSEGGEVRREGSGGRQSVDGTIVVELKRGPHVVLNRVNGIRIVVRFKVVGGIRVVR